MRKIHDCRSVSIEWNTWICILFSNSMHKLLQIHQNVFVKQGITDMNENRSTSKINRWISMFRSFRNEAPINCGRQSLNRFNDRYYGRYIIQNDVRPIKIAYFFPSNYIWSQIIVRDACVWLRSKYRIYLFLKYHIKYTLHEFLMTAMIFLRKMPWVQLINYAKKSRTDLRFFFLHNR